MSGDIIKVVRRRRTGERVQAFDPGELRRRRQEKGLTLDALGAQISVTRASLIAYEKGARRPGLETFRALSAALGCAPEDLTGPAEGPASLAELRIRAGVTKTELAARLGMARATWDQIERGAREPSAELVPLLARSLGVDREAVVVAGRVACEEAMAAMPPRPEAVASPTTPSAGRAGPGRLTDQFAAEVFIGRDEQLVQLHRLLATSRLVTLTGTPGVGKTRVAVEVGRRVAERHPGGVWLVELAATRDPALVPQAVASALGLREQRGQSLTETLWRRLAPEGALLVLDNCEHLVEAVGALVERLLDGCPELTLLLTSRRPLELAAETVWTVPPMAVTPPADSQELPESVQLFREIAVATSRTFTLTPQVAPVVADICARLEGIPLAIQLAAARINVLTPQEILARLDDPLSLLTGGSGSPRHRTLQAALDWSHDLLPPAERLLLRRLSVFSGACGIDAVEAVCAGLPGDEVDVLDPLAGLVTKSLVIADTSGDRARYRLLEAIREYAADRAEQVGETAELRASHLRWCTGLAEASEAGLTSADQLAWLRRMDAERDNLRSAVAWATSSGDVGSALRLAGALTLYWRIRGHFREGTAWLAAALAMPGADDDPHLATALRGRGFLSLMVQELDVAAPALERALALSRVIGDVQGEARCLLLLGNAKAMDDPVAPVSLFEESAALARRVGDRWCLGHALSMQARALMVAGQDDAATTLLEECVQEAREKGELQSLRIGLYLLGTLARFHGDLETAETLIAEGLEVTRRLEEPFDTAAALESLGEMASARGDPDGSRLLLAEALDLFRQTGDPASVSRTLAALGAVALRQGDLAAAAERFEESVATSEASGHPSEPSAREGLGELAVARGDAARGRALLEGALEVATHLRDRAVVARCSLALGDLNRQRGAVRIAAGQLQEALRLRVDLADQPGIADTLDTLALLASDCARWEDAALLLGAAQGVRERAGCVPAVPVAARRDEARRRADERIGVRRVAEVWERGRALPTADAVDAAQGWSRVPTRPVLGWPSLTRSERGVTELVVEGLSNSQIAARLFVTKSTVEGHLSNIFGKLGLESRAQLVREGVRRQLAEDD